MHLANSDIRLAAGASVEFALTFAPESNHALGVDLVLTTDSRETPEVRVVVRGMPVDRPFIVEPAQVDFGNVRRGLITSKRVRLRNVLDESITVDVADIEGLRSSSSSRQTTNSVVLDPHGEGFVDVAFSPSELGQANARFALEGHCQFTCRQLVTLTGVGVESALDCSPSVVDFGAVNPGDCVQRTVACTNPFEGTITVRGMTIEPPTEELTLGQHAPIEVHARESKHLSVEYCPADLGSDRSRIALLTTESDGRAGSLSVSLLGEGGGPNINVTPRSVHFGAPIGGSMQRRVLLTNSGYSMLTVSELCARAARNEISVVMPHLPMTVAPGEEEIVTLEFRPTTATESHVDLVVRTNDPDEGEVRVPVSATGLRRSRARSRSLRSISRSVSSRSARPRRSACALHATGEEHCAFLKPRLVHNRMFKLNGTIPTSGLVRPAEYPVFEIAYAPLTGSSLAGDADTFAIDVPNATPNVAEVTLHGIAAPSDLTVHPNPMDFGQVAVDYARHRTLSIYNVGTSAEEITSINRELGSSIDFSFTSTPAFPLHIAPGTSVGFDVQYGGTPSAQTSRRSPCTPPSSRRRSSSTCAVKRATKTAATSRARSAAPTAPARAATHRFATRPPPAKSSPRRRTRTETSISTVSRPDPSISSSHTDTSAAERASTSSPIRRRRCPSRSVSSLRARTSRSSPVTTTRCKTFSARSAFRSTPTRERRASSPTSCATRRSSTRTTSCSSTAASRIHMFAIRRSSRTCKTSSLAVARSTRPIGRTTPSKARSRTRSTSWGMIRCRTRRNKDSKVRCKGASSIRDPRSARRTIPRHRDVRGRLCGHRLGGTDHARACRRRDARCPHRAQASARRLPAHAAIGKGRVHHLPQRGRLPRSEYEGRARVPGLRVVIRVRLTDFGGGGEQTLAQPIGHNLATPPLAAEHVLHHGNPAVIGIDEANFLWQIDGVGFIDDLAGHPIDEHYPTWM